MRILGKETKKCPYCGEEILTEAKKCKHCGEWLTEDAQEKEKKEQKPCPICGEIIDADAIVCPYCNEKIGPDTSDRVSANVAPKRNVREEPKETSCNVEAPATYDDDEDRPGLIEHYFVDVFFKHYTDFQGSISRKQFWMAYLFYTISYIAVFAIGLLFGFPFLSTIYTLATIIPCIAYTVRRLHDTGKSCWWFFIALVPFIGPIWLLVLLCQKGELEDEPVMAKQTDWIAIAIISIATVVGIAIGLKDIDKKINYFLYGTYESFDEPSKKISSDSIADFKEEKAKTEETKTTEYGYLIATSTSGKYEYYRNNNDNINLYQKDTEEGIVRAINIEESIPEVDISINCFLDYTVYKNKLVFTCLTNNDPQNSCSAFYLNLDNQTWQYICHAKFMQFSDDKTTLETESSTGEKEVITLSEL